MRVTNVRKRSLLASVLVASLGIFTITGALADEDEDGPFIPKLINSSTIPSNGDLNPYGVAFVPGGFPAGGTIAAGDVLVSNFNNSASNSSPGGIQGAGTTIVKLTPSGTLAPPGAAETFFTSKLAGLSTALGVLRRGFVIVGNVPTKDGTFATIKKGALQVIDRNGIVKATWIDATFLDGPWDLTLDDDGARAHLFVSSVLNGTVSRLDLAVSTTAVTVLKMTRIAMGYTSVANSAAVVLGPTGLAYDEGNDTLYVASTGDNAIYSVAHASHRSSAVNRGSLVFADAHLRGPLALRFAPNGHLLTANGDTVNADTLHPSEIVEFTKSGHFVREYNVDPTQGGAFGIDTLPHEIGGFNYAVIDDVTNSLSVYRLSAH